MNQKLAALLGLVAVAIVVIAIIWLCSRSWCNKVPENVDIVVVFKRQSYLLAQELMRYIEALHKGQDKHEHMQEIEAIINNQAGHLCRNKNQLKKAYMDKYNAFFSKINQDVSCGERTMSGTHTPIIEMVDHNAIIIKEMEACGVVLRGMKDFFITFDSYTLEYQQYVAVNGVVEDAHNVMLKDYRDLINTIKV